MSEGNSDVILFLGLLACQTNQDSRNILAREKDMKCIIKCLEKFDKTLREHNSAIERNNALILESIANEQKFENENTWDAFKRLCYSKFGFEGGKKIIAAAGLLLLLLTVVLIPAALLCFFS